MPSLFVESFQPILTVLMTAWQSFLSLEYCLIKHSTLSKYVLMFSPSSKLLMLQQNVCIRVALKKNKHTKRNIA
jgi:hypothetical protein